MNKVKPITVQVSKQKTKDLVIVFIFGFIVSLASHYYGIRTTPSISSVDIASTLTHSMSDAFYQSIQGIVFAWGFVGVWYLYCHRKYKSYFEKSTSQEVELMNARKGSEVHQMFFAGCLSLLIGIALYGLTMLVGDGLAWSLV